MRLYDQNDTLPDGDGPLKDILEKFLMKFLVEVIIRMILALLAKMRNLLKGPGFQGGLVALA